MASRQETFGIKGFDLPEFDAQVRRGLRPSEISGRLARVVVDEFGQGKVGDVLRWLDDVAAQHEGNPCLRGIADAAMTALELGPETLEDLDGVKASLGLSGVFKGEQPMQGPAA